MSWDTYPADYRSAEVQTTLAAVQAGESVLALGLSGAGKSNFLGFLANRCATATHPLYLIDTNRLSEPTPAAFWRLLLRALGGTPVNDNAFEALDEVLLRRLNAAEGAPKVITFLLDLSPVLNRAGQAFGAAQGYFFSNLRALRDAHKFRLAYVFAARHPLPANSELAELFYAHTFWLKPLAASDAVWNVHRYAARRGLGWDAATAEALIAASGGYAALLRAACEAHAEGAPLTLPELAAHPAVQRRLAEFWAAAPTEAEFQQSALTAIPLLQKAEAAFDLKSLTPKERLLLEYLQAHAGEVCEKEALMRAVWSEDKTFKQGLRDDSLTQLVRRLREKIETDPNAPRYIHTVIGRGYRFLTDDGQP